MKKTVITKFSGGAFGAALAGVLGMLTANFDQARANDIAYAETILDTDFVSAGVGGMRNSGSATINLTGLSGTVNKAYLYWHGPMNVANPLANAIIRLNGQSITGENIGFSDDNCWGFNNSSAYRAEVTSFVTSVRNGSYVLTSFVKQGTNINANGASLLVFFNDGNSENNRDIVLFEGNDSNAPNIYDALGWNIFLPGITYSTGRAFIQAHVSDGQTWEDDFVMLNGGALQGRNGFQGNSVPSANNGPENNGSLWDIKTWEITSFLAPGTNSLTMTHGYIGRADGSARGDCVSLIVAAINLPEGSAPPPPPPNNIAPVVTGTPTITINNPNPITVQALATDADGDALTYTIAVDGTVVQSGNIPAGNPTTVGTLSVTTTLGLGQHTVVFTANDGESTGNFTTVVNVIDNTPPDLIVPPNITVPTDPGKSNAVVTYVVTATDNFPGVTFIALPPSGNTFPIGTTTVTATAVDTSGNTTQKTFTITVTDGVPPTIHCPADILRATDLNSSNAVVHYSIPAADNQPGMSLNCEPASGSVFPIGITTVVCNARDAAGNTATCMFKVTIVDVEPPVITTPTNMILVADLGQCEKVVTYNVTVTDNAPGATLVCTPPSGSTFPLGTTPVVCIAADVAGNKATNGFTITIQDKEKPTFDNLPGNITVGTDPGKSTAVVTFDVTATDSCSTPTVSCRPASGSAFPLGGTPVICQATDGAGNVQSGTFTVTVVDTEPPVITVPTNRILTTDLGQCSAVVNYTVTLRDNVPGATVVCAPPSGSTFPKGVTTVNCVATDLAGNSTNASFTVNIGDAQKPVLSLPANMMVVIPTTQTSAVVNYNVSATDNCSTPTVVVTPPSGSTFPVGTTTVNVTATDADNNVTTGSFTVTVKQNTSGDNEPPVITVPTNRVIAADFGQCSALVNYTVTVRDNLPGATVVCTPPSGSIFPKGVTTVNCVATDRAGNLANASFTVTIVDTQKPVLSLPVNMIVIIASNETSAVVNYNVSATDNCSTPTVVSTPPSGSTFPIGTTTVNVTATDADGNVSTGSFTVTVKQETGGDNEPPVIVSITPSKKTLWPPNHKMVSITLSVKATDNSGKPVTARIISVTSNEPENGLGDGDTGPDWKILSNLKLQLRAERSGTGTGRTYTITVEVKDAAGNITYGTTTVSVPHDMSKKK